jgi:hypothetical protein
LPPLMARPRWLQKSLFRWRFSYLIPGFHHIRRDGATAQIGATIH